MRQCKKRIAPKSGEGGLSIFPLPIKVKTMRDQISDVLCAAGFRKYWVLSYGKYCGVVVDQGVSDKDLIIAKYLLTLAESGLFLLDVEKTDKGYLEITVKEKP